LKKNEKENLQTQKCFLLPIILGFEAKIDYLEQKTREKNGILIF